MSRNKFDFDPESFMAHVSIHSVPFFLGPCLSYWTMTILQHTMYHQCQHLVPMQEVMYPLRNEVKAKGAGLAGGYSMCSLSDL